jgi:hypothetical protein
MVSSTQVTMRGKGWKHYYRSPGHYIYRNDYGEWVSCVAIFGLRKEEDGDITIFIIIIIKQAMVL